MKRQKELSIFDILNGISNASDRLFAIEQKVSKDKPEAAQYLNEANKHLCDAYASIETYLEVLK